MTNETFNKIVQVGLKINDHHTVFNQIQIVNDINSFKKIMRKRNKVTYKISNLEEGEGGRRWKSRSSMTGGR